MRRGLKEMREAVMGLSQRWKGFLGRGKNKCKGPEAEIRLMGVRNRKEASMAGQEGARGT